VLSISDHYSRLSSLLAAPDLVVLVTVSPLLRSVTVRGCSCSPAPPHSIRLIPLLTPHMPGRDDHVARQLPLHLDGTRSA
jgi:hypothetical protein